MPATIEKVTDTERRIKFTLLESDVDAEIQVRLKSLQRTTTLPGFRKGKVPLKLIDTRFRSDVKAEVLDDLVSMQVRQTLQEQTEPLYTRPVVEKISNDDGGGDYDVSVCFETYPEFTKKEIKGKLVEIPELVMSEAEYDNLLEELRGVFHDWESVERKPQEGDYVAFKWVNASEPDSALEDAERVPIIIGEKKYRVVENALLHMDIGVITVMDLAREYDPTEESVLVETALTKVRIESVSKPLKDKFNKNALINLFGVESEDDDRLRDRLKLFVRRECNPIIRRVKELEVGDILLAANDVDPPESALILAFAERLMDTGVTKDEAFITAVEDDQSEELSLMKADTRTRLKLTWILKEIAMDLGLTGERREELAEQMLREEAEDFPDPERAYNEMLPVTREYEEISVARKVIDTLLEDAYVQTIPMNYWDIIHLDDALDEVEEEALSPKSPIIRLEPDIEVVENVIVDAYGNPIRR